MSSTENEICSQEISTQEIIDEAMKIQNLNEFLEKDLNDSNVELYHPSYWGLQNAAWEEHPIEQLLQTYEDRIEKLEIEIDTISKENKQLKKFTNNIREEIDYNTDSIYYIEKDLNQYQQYGRRESLEISGIPEDIPQNELELRIINLLQRIGCHNLSSYEIVACHRLKKDPKSGLSKVIVRFINRKRVYQALINRQFLKFRVPNFPNIYITESLCAAYKNIYNICSELRKDGEIKRLWTHNGMVQFKRNDYEKTKNIPHINHLDFYFSGWEKYIEE